MGTLSLDVKILAKSFGSKPPQLLVAGGTQATRLDVNTKTGALAMPVNLIGEIAKSVCLGSAL